MEKSEVLAMVASSALPKHKAPGELGVPRSTYYRWLRRSEQRGLEDCGRRQAPMEQTDIQGSLPYSVGGEGDAGTESQTAGRVGYRQHGVLSVGVHGVPHPEKGETGEEA